MADEFRILFVADVVGQPGREVRILVKPEQIDDTAAQLMARDIAKRIETELSFPGQIRVTVVRETRAVEYAK